MFFSVKNKDGRKQAFLHLFESPLSFLQIIMLVLAWHLEAANMGYFTKDEWLRGMTILQ